MKKRKRMRVKTFENFDLDTIKDLAIVNDVKVIDHKFINKFALMVLNNFKRYKVFSITDPGTIYPIFRGIKRIQFAYDKNLKGVSAYYQPYRDSNNKLYMFQIVTTKLDLAFLHHEIQHAIYDMQYESYGKDYAIMDLADILSSICKTDNMDFEDLYNFFINIYMTIPDETESYISEIYQELLKIKTTQSNFKENLEKSNTYDDFLDLTKNRTTKDYYLEKLSKSASFRVRFFSELNHFLKNSKKIDKLKFRKGILKVLLGQNLIYDKKISQQKADELAKFWIDYFEKRASDIFVRVNNIKYLLKP